jgi:hypothetical protein
MFLADRRGCPACVVAGGAKRRMDRLSQKDMTEWVADVTYESIRRQVEKLKQVDKIRAMIR